MAIKQLSVFVDNKKGALSDITSFRAKQGIDLRAMSIADTQDFGILRLIVNDTERAAALLRETEAIAKVTDVIAVALTDEPGGLAKVLEVLAAKEINMEYLYAFTAADKGHAYVVFRVQDNAQAEQVLQDAGIPVLTDADGAKL